MKKNDTAIPPIAVPPSQAWDGNDGPWSTFNIHVGNPPQAARVLVSTVVGETWVISDNATQGGCLRSDSSNCPQSRGGLVNVNKSSSWQDQGIFELGAELNLPDYINNYDNGDYGLDSLGIGLPGADGVTLDNQVVAALATKDYYLGNMGVTSRPTNFTGFNDPHTSFLSSLKEQFHVPSLTFGYTAGNQYRLKKIFGSLTLGGYDASRLIPNDVSFQFATDISRDLVVGVQSITYSDAKNTNSILYSQGHLSFVDSTVPHLWLPKDACTAFEKAFGLQYNSTVDRYLVNDTLHDKLQKQNASVTFNLGNDISGGSTVQITLPYAAFDLQVGPPVVNNTQNYFPIRRADNDTQYTLGRTLLQEAYLIVDYERSNFSLSQCLFQGNSPANLVAIPSANLTGPGVTKTQGSGGLSTGAIVGIVIALAVALAASGLGAFFCIRKRKQKRVKQEEIKQVEDAEKVDPIHQKAELGGIPRPQLNELYGGFKPGLDSDDRNEMEGSNAMDAKLRAEMEGSRGLAEMESNKSPADHHEMQATLRGAPIEMWAGPHGLYELSPTPEDSSRPSPASRLPSSSGTGRPSPASVASDPRTSRFSWGRRHRSSRPHTGASMTQGDSSGVSSPTDDPSTDHDSGAELWGSRSANRPRYPPPAVTPQDVSPSSSKARRVRATDNLTRRLEQANKYQSTSHLSVSSPTSESESERRQTGHSGADRWNTRFGSQPREHVAAQHSSVSSPSRSERSERSRPTRASTRQSGQPEVSSPSETSPRHRHYDSWTSRVRSAGEPSPGISSESSMERKHGATTPGGFF